LSVSSSNQRNTKPEEPKENNGSTLSKESSPITENSSHRNVCANRCLKIIITIFVIAVLIVAGCMSMVVNESILRASTTIKPTTKDTNVGFELITREEWKANELKDEMEKLKMPIIGLIIGKSDKNETLQ
jgi:hypothetical protein